MLNMSKLASELTISEPTVRRYIQILETIYLVQLIPAWSSGATGRVRSTRYSKTEAGAWSAGSPSTRSDVLE